MTRDTNYEAFAGHPPLCQTNSRPLPPPFLPNKPAAEECRAVWRCAEIPRHPTISATRRGLSAAPTPRARNDTWQAISAKQTRPRSEPAVPRTWYVAAGASRGLSAGEAKHGPVPRCAFERYPPSATSTERLSRSFLLCSPFGQIRPPRKDSTNERLAFHKAKPRGAIVVTVTGAY